MAIGGGSRLVIAGRENRSSGSVRLRMIALGIVVAFCVVCAGPFIMQHRVSSGSAAIRLRQRSILPQEAQLLDESTTYDSTQFIDPNPSSTDEFGEATAISRDGTTAVVGAQQADTDQGQISGAAYVYTYSNGAWTFAATLRASDATTFSQLGSSLAISSDGSEIVAGAAGGAFGNSPNQQTQGSAYVFDEPPGGWSGIVQQDGAIASHWTFRADRQLESSNLC